jgi:hypothetical protein
MTIETEFGELLARLVELQTALEYLAVFIEDKPQAHKLADDLGEAVTDLSSRIGQALEDARQAQAAVQHPADLTRARAALASCHEGFNFVSRHMLTELMSEKQLAELARLGRRRGGEWPGWATGVRQALDQCQTPLHDVNQALFRCWQEMAERSVATSVSVQATNIAQQITAPEESVLTRGDTLVQEG